MKNANFMASLKAFFGKAWTATKAFSIKAGKWIVANKLISIPVAVVLVGGIACAIALPIALHEHDFATEWSTDADNHWHSAICSHEEEKSDLGAHAYDNACDTTCNVCGATRTVGAHAYDNDCDTTCNICGAIRTVGAHVYDNACDNTCNICGATRTVGAHVYDNACDTTCNVCGATRTITHDHADTLTAGDTTHYYLCSVCGDKKDEVAHVFDKTIASSEYLKAVATATTKAQYYKSCVCGKASATEYFETDKTAGTLANIQDLSKTYDKVELANPTYETNSDGEVTIEWYQGDTKLDAKPVNAGTYKVKVIIAESATYTGISVEREFTIANKMLSNLSFEFVYRGEVNFETDYLTEAQGILAADVADGIFIFVHFDSKNVGATVTDTEIDFGEEADSYENYEIDMATFTASITPKTLNYLEFTKVYDGVGFNDYTLGTEHGIVSGDVVALTCDEELDYNAGSYYFIDKTDDISITDAGIDRAFLDGADAGNYQFANQVISGLDGYEMGGKLTVTKRSVWAENVEFTYDGYHWWSGEESPNQIVFQNMANGETMDSSFVTWTFDSINVDATLTSVEFMDEDDGRSNYEIDFSKCTASIIPRVIDNLTYEFEYSGMEYHQAIISKNEHSGIVGDDQISLEVCFATPNVGSALDTDGEFGFEPGFVEENYVLGENYSFSIVPRPLNLLDIKVTYDDGIISSFDLTAADGIVAGDDVYLSGDGWQNYDVAGDVYTLTDDLDSEDYDEGVWIGGADKANYKFSYDTDGSVGKVTVLPYILDFTGEYVKDADGTNNVTFTQTVNHSYGDVTVKVVLPLLDLQGTPITASGIYTELSATFGTPAFYVNDAVVEGYDLSDSFYPDDLADRQFTVEITGELFATIDTYYSSRNLINLLSVDRGAIKPGDVLTVIAPDGTTTTVTVAKIVKGGSEKNYVSHTSSDFGNYGLGLTNIGDTNKLVRGAVLIHEGDTAPKATSVIFGTMSTITSDSVNYVVTPSSSYDITIHGLTFACKITPLNADQTIVEGDSAQVMISLTGGTVYTVAGEAFTIRTAALTPMATGTVEDITVAVDTEKTVGQTQLVHDPIDIAAGETVVFKITNTLGRNVTRFSLWGDSARLDAKDDAYTVALYDSNGALIEATYDVDQYTFDKSDSTEYAVANGQTVYVVLTLTKAVDGVELTFY